MDKLIINGPSKLQGSVDVSVSKNSSLPIMAATLLIKGKTTLKDLPKLKDIETLTKVLEQLGANVQKNQDTNETVFDTSSVKSFEAVYDIVRTMRAGVLVLGPLLARYGKAKVSLPGGCAIGTRPIDLHLDGLEKLGAHIQIISGYVQAEARRLKGCEINLKFPSVGATENLMMAATLAEGTTIIRNAAQEPEIKDLADFLNASGANVVIHENDPSQIHIRGVEELKGINYRPIPDRIEAATYLLIGLTTRSTIRIEKCRPDHLKSLLKHLEDAGAEIDCTENSMEIKPSFDFRPVNVVTEPYPGFPTDVQAQMMSFLLTVEGESRIHEKIFENRFMHVSELQRLGANIQLQNGEAIINGGRKLSGAPVMCTDLRASAALIQAALVAEGESSVARIYHLDRGYEELEAKLGAMMAQVERVRS